MSGEPEIVQEGFSKTTCCRLLMSLIKGRMVERGGKRAYRRSFEEQIRQDPALADAAIIILTSANQSAMLARCREIGVAGYLTKPVSQNDLLDAFLTLVGGAGRGTGALTTADKGSIQFLRKLPILLAEDNEVNQMLAVRILENREQYRRRPALRDGSS